MIKFVFPLQWPENYFRTLSEDRKKANFGTRNESAKGRRPWKLHESFDGLAKQLRLLQASNVVVTSNHPLQPNGLPIPEYETPIEDPGLSIYFTCRDVSCTIAVDLYMRLEDNLHSLDLTIDALRSIERYGSIRTEQALATYKFSPLLSSGHTAYEQSAVKQLEEDNEFSKPYQTVKDFSNDASLLTFPKII
jgi:hypothetical protein